MYMVLSIFLTLGLYQIWSNNFLCGLGFINSNYSIGDIVVLYISDKIYGGGTADGLLTFTGRLLLLVLRVVYISLLSDTLLTIVVSSCVLAAVSN